MERQGPAFRGLAAIEWLVQAAAKRACRDLRPRRHSNLVLRQYLPNFSGDVVNVSGWEDRDKEGGFYRDYFGTPTRYTVTNIEGDAGMPAHVDPGVISLHLDLEQPVPAELHESFDVVFSHTVLEHVYPTLTALESMHAMTRDVVVIVLPFSQNVHYTRSFGDYVRLSPLYLKRYFEERGYEVLLSTANEQPFFPIYSTFIASRHPGRHTQAFADAPRRFEVQIRPDRWGRYGKTGMTHVADE